MSAISRFGDIACGVCFCHDTPIGTCGIIIASENTVFCDNRPVARTGDVIVTFCGHVSVIVSSSSVSYSNNIGVARTGDAVAGCMIGTICTGSNITYSD
jgi:uncharacterized Zn-binding protein involved in type VI secretion